jgi:D-alanyl-D-alanine carboxypeptidase/D-alanyl-D-alanine-endopeptidase (penicillin-binding protein 4)
LVVTVLAGLAISSMTAAVARSQGAGSATREALPPERQRREVQDDRREREALAPEEEEATAVGPAPLVAPPDPKARVLWLHDRIAAAIAGRPRLSGARVAVSVTDLASGREMVAHEADRGMSIASAAKLLTATAALATLGSGFRWRTAVYGAPPDDKGEIAGPLYVRARGDPMLGVSDLRVLATEVVARGVRSVDAVVIDGSYFDDDVEPPRFDDQPGETAYFRAPVASFGVARSATTVVVVAEPGGAATVTLDPEPGDYVRLVNRGVTSVTRGRTRLKVEVHSKPDHLEIEVSGHIRWGEGSWEIRKRVDDPARYAGELFRRALTEQGVKVKARAIASGAVPVAAKLLAVHDSAPLSDVVRQMNKASDNYLAECVLKTLGAETKRTSGPATWNDGQRLGAVRRDRGLGAPAHQRAARGIQGFSHLPRSARVAAGRRRRRDARAALPRPRRCGSRARQDWHARQGRHARWIPRNR